MAQARSRRLRGRPSAGKDNHRGRLVDIARDLFAARGFTATTLRQVALGAGVTPALAHYYFTDKAGLFDAVLREHIAPLLAGMQSTISTRTQDPAGALARFVQQFTLLASRHPWLPPLLLRELSEATADRESLAAKVFTTQYLQPLTLQLQQLVTAGQASGVIRSDLRAEWIVLSVLSLSAFPLARDASSVQALTLHRLAVLRDGLKAAPGIRVVTKRREITGV